MCSSIPGKKHHVIKLILRIQDPSSKESVEFLTRVTKPFLFSVGHKKYRLRLLIFSQYDSQMLDEKEFIFQAVC